MASLFVSDLHLCAEQPATTAAFLAFLAGPAQTAEELYILGDLFDRWIGDDAPQPEDQPVLAALRVLTDRGIPVWVMHGNHDFLYGARFSADTGCRLLPDPSVIDLYGTPTLLMHGDLLCSDDVAYQRFRKMVRDPAWQAEQLAKPVVVRQGLARDLQAQSRAHTTNKDQAIMDVSQAEVESVLRAHSVYQLIHGHTHRPAHHRFLLDGREAQRIVLPNWRTQGDAREKDNMRGGYLACGEKECRILGWV
ncbi:UDP-2,3-diacylglucosamine hydrolase [Gammaproteobacteria bacterium]